MSDAEAVKALESGHEPIGQKLRSVGVDPDSSGIRTLEVGPIFMAELGDEDSFARAKGEMDALLAAVAGLLSTRRYQVLGEAPASRVYDRGLFTRVIEILDREFPPR